MQQRLLRDDIGLKLSTAEEMEKDLSWQSMSKANLKKESAETLKGIAKSYGHPTSKNKDELADLIRTGPKPDLTMTETEKVLKCSFLAPLQNKDATAHKLGSLNERNVRRAMKGVFNGLNLELESLYEPGFVVDKSNKWAGTSLDGLATVRDQSCKDSETNKEAEDSETNEEADSVANDESGSESEADDSSKEGTFHCGLEIKTPSNAALRTKLNGFKYRHGMFTRCTFGGESVSTCF